MDTIYITKRYECSHYCKYMGKTKNKTIVKCNIDFIILYYIYKINTDYNSYETK